jgi:uncharacterized protein (DUF302 family)
MIVSPNKGLVNLRTSRSVFETMNLLESVVRSRGLSVVARVDHAGDAVKARLQMPPTELLIFGNPKAGTPLMNASPTAGIDLPLKALAWQDLDGQVWLSYNSPRYLQERHEIPETLLKNIESIASICEEVVR